MVIVTRSGKKLRPIRPPPVNREQVRRNILASINDMGLTSPAQVKPKSILRNPLVKDKENDTDPVIDIRPRILRTAGSNSTSSDARGITWDPDVSDGRSPSYRHTIEWKLREKSAGNPRVKRTFVGNDDDSDSEGLPRRNIPIKTRNRMPTSFKQAATSPENGQLSTSSACNLIKDNQEKSAAPDLDFVDFEESSPDSIPEPLTRLTNRSSNGSESRRNSIHSKNATPKKESLSSIGKRDSTPQAKKELNLSSQSVQSRKRISSLRDDQSIRSTPAKRFRASYVIEEQMEQTGWWAFAGQLLATLVTLGAIYFTYDQGKDGQDQTTFDMRAIPDDMADWLDN